MPDPTLFSLCCSCWYQADRCSCANPSLPNFIYVPCGTVNNIPEIEFAFLAVNADCYHIDKRTSPQFSVLPAGAIVQPGLTPLNTCQQCCNTTFFLEVEICNCPPGSQCIPSNVWISTNSPPPPNCLVFRDPSPNFTCYFTTAAPVVSPVLPPGGTLLLPPFECFDFCADCEIAGCLSCPDPINERCNIFITPPPPRSYRINIAEINFDTTGFPELCCCNWQNLSIILPPAGIPAPTPTCRWFLGDIHEPGNCIGLPGGDCAFEIGSIELICTPLDYTITIKFQTRPDPSVFSFNAIWRRIDIPPQTVIRDPCPGGIYAIESPTPNTPCDAILYSIIYVYEHL